MYKLVQELKSKLSLILDKITIIELRVKSGREEKF